MSNLRIYPRGLPQILQRRTVLVLNFGSLWALIIIDFFAISYPLLAERHAELLEKGESFLIGPCCRDDSHVQTADTDDLVLYI